MPDIRLQDYVEKIKEFIRSVRLDEAIATASISDVTIQSIPKPAAAGEACLEKETTGR